MELQRKIDLTSIQIFLLTKVGLKFFFYHIALSNTPVLYKVKKNKKIINAIIANAVIMFFLLVFLSGVIIISYLSEKEQKLKINII